MLSELLLSVTDSVFSYVIDKLDPAETIKSWLKREPARLAFQKALARAYSAFARQYPEYTAGLFNQSFLEKEAAPELAKLLTRGRHPDPAVLAQLWAKSLGLEPDSEFSQRATKPVADFLSWLEAELKAEPVFQPLFDSRALDSLPKIEAGIEKLTAELTRSLDAALKQAGEYEKVVLSIGGNVQGSVIVGNNNQVSVTKVYYSGQFTSLDDYYIHPDDVFQRVRVEEFVGREWLTAKVDTFLNDPSQKSGAFVLVGDAGVGKTSFMAHLVNERGYLHFFSEQAPGDSGLQRALQSLGSQLVTRYQIDPYKDRDTLTQTAVFPDFLERLMRMAVQGLCNGEKIVIICDALDEAGTFPDGNVLGLPNVLPDGVYLILSQRPVNVKLPNLSPRIETLEAQGEHNLQDMQTYLSAIAKRPEIAGQIRARDYSETFFIQTLQEKSQGVWMYLYYIIREIENGSRAPLDLENLPIGLVGYYADFWDDWRNGRRGRGEGPHKWDELYAPLLTTLAAAQEPITIEQLIEWASVEAKPREVARLLNEAWRAFIAERETPKGRLYFPYHLSFRDFVTGKVDFGKLSPAQGNLVRDLAEQTFEAHQRILKIFEVACQGKWEVLAEQNYPRLHLSAHFNGAKAYETLVSFLTEGYANITWAEARYQKEETYAGYLNDLELVWNYAKGKNDLALLVRCMLIENSIHSLAAKMPPILIAELGKSGLWSYARCLAAASQKSDVIEQAASLVLLAPDLPPSMFQKALSIVREIQDGYYRARALLAIAPYLPDELQNEASSIAYEIKNEHSRIEVLSTLAPHLSDELKTRALVTANEIRKETRFWVKDNRTLSYKSKTRDLAAVSKIGDDKTRIEVLSIIALYLPDKLKIQVLTKALTAARELQDEDTRAATLSVLAMRLPDELKVQALMAVREIRKKSTQAQALSIIVPNLPDKLQPWALSIIREISDGEACSRALLTLAPRLCDELKTQALTIACEIQNEYSRARALSALVAYLPDRLKAQTFVAARNIRDADASIFALLAIAPHLPGKLQALALAQTLTTARENQDNYAYAHTYTRVRSALAPRLPDELKPQALTMIGEISMEDDRAEGLSGLVPYLTDELKAQALSITRTIWDEYYRTNVLLVFAVHMPNELQSQILEAVNEIQDEFYRASILSALAPYLLDELKTQALTIAREIQNERSRAHALSALAPYLFNKLKTEALTDALIAMRKIRDEEYRTDVLLTIVPHLEQVDQKTIFQEILFCVEQNELQQLVEKWKDIQYDGLLEKVASFLQTIAPKERNDGLQIVAVMVEALSSLSGRNIAPELYRAISDVTRWWP